MKKHDVISHQVFAWLMAPIVLCACGKASPPAPHTANPGPGLSVLTDRATGCQYLALSGQYAGGLTPRLDHDGWHMGCNVLQGNSDARAKKE